MAGNTLGTRSYYQYISDGGQNYSILMDDDLAAAVSATLNDSNPPPPRRFKTRAVYVETPEGDRKRLTVTDPDSSLYKSNVTQTVTIDDLAFNTTGRVGESLSFARNTQGGGEGGGGEGGGGEGGGGET